MMPRIKTFLRKYWYLVAGAVVAIVLLTRRGVILRNISRLRAKLDASQRTLIEAQHQAEITAGTDAVEAYEAQAAAAREDIKATHAELGALHEEYSSVTGRINAARSWKELEALRDEGNQR